MVEFETKHFWSLRMLMSSQWRPVEEEPTLAGRFCGPIAAGTKAKRLCDAAPDFEDWKTLQARMWRDKARAVVDGADGKTLVFLIHGFNVIRGDADFAYVKERILANSKAPETLRFVEVHWDGGDYASAWNRAQYSGPFIGLGLRQLLNGIEEADGSNKRPIRIVTHSSGAFVAAALLGDSRRAFDSFHSVTLEACEARPGDETPKLHCEDNKWARKHLGGLQGPGVGPADLMSAPQFSDIRVLMFAAATTYQSFARQFLDDSSDAAAFKGVTSRHVKLFITVNPSDQAVNKQGFGPYTPFTSDTPLGAIPSNVCRLSANFEEQKRRGIDEGRRVYDFDFERKDPLGKKKGKRWRAVGSLESERKAHSWPLYLDQAAYETYGVLDLFMNYETTDSPAFLSRYAGSKRVDCDKARRS